jgi:hypothetical protein
MAEGVENSKKVIIKKINHNSKKIHVGIQYPEQISQEERMYIISSKKL